MAEIIGIFNCSAPHPFGDKYIPCTGLYQKKFFGLAVIKLPFLGSYVAPPQPGSPQIRTPKRPSLRAGSLAKLLSDNLLVGAQSAAQEEAVIAARASGSPQQRAEV